MSDIPIIVPDLSPVKSTVPFTTIISAYLDQLPADECIEVMIATQDFAALFEPDEQADVLTFFYRSCDGFKAFEREFCATNRETMQ